MSNGIRFGAIRWDAWYGHDDSDYNAVVNQCERSLSPKQYRYRAPYFSTLNENGKMRILPFSSNRADEELMLAEKAGIDFFAYVWYSRGKMTLSRRHHATADTKLKMCAIIDDNAITSAECEDEIVALMKTDKWLKTEDSRPIIFYFTQSFDKIKISIEGYKAKCRKADCSIPMFFSMVDDDISKVLQSGCDGISEYSVWGRDGQSYESLTQKAKNAWQRGKDSNVQIIPCLAGGWDATPRYVTPVTWCENDAQSYAVEPNGKQLEAHINDAYKWMNENKDVTRAGTMLIYAWNEHDEGGWICPTVTVDNDGFIITDENGCAIKNTERLDAVRRALKKNRESDK